MHILCVSYHTVILKYMEAQWIDDIPSTPMQIKPSFFLSHQCPNITTQPGHWHNQHQRFTHVTIPFQEWERWNNKWPKFKHGCKSLFEAPPHQIVPQSPELKGYQWIFQLWKLMKFRSSWLDEAGWIDVFTDGSCHYPKHADLRFASWAVCRAASQFHLNESTVIAAGGVPGVLQSAYRAELFAVVQALQWAVKHKVKIRVWSDCQGVVHKVQKLTKGLWTPNINSCHFDLWVQAQETLLILPQGTCRITKVAAHTDVQEAKGPLEQWAFMHNALADRAARLANQCRPQQFWEVQQCHSQLVMHVNRISSEIQKVILAVSKRAVMRTALEDELSVEPLEAPLKVHRTPEQSDQDGPVAMELTKLVPLPAAERFGHRLTALTAAWLQEGFQQAAHGHENRRWIAWTQLYIDFQQRTGDVGPHYEKGWKDPAVRPLLKARQVSFKKRCSWFVQLVKSILKCNQIHLTGNVTRPDSVMLALHTASIYIAWPMDRTKSVERWLHTALSRAATRDGSTLKDLPFAKQLEGQISLNIPVGPLGR